MPRSEHPTRLSHDVRALSEVGIVGKDRFMSHRHLDAEHPAVLPQCAESWTDELSAVTLLPCQVQRGARSPAERDGMTRLAHAVLESAVHEYVTLAGATDRRRREQFAQVHRWFEATNSSWPFSFEGTCAHLGLDADYLRRGLRARIRPQLVGGRAAPTVERPRLPRAA